MSSVRVANSRGRSKKTPRVDSDFIDHSARKEIIQRMTVVGLFLVTITFIVAASISLEISRRSEQARIVPSPTSKPVKSADLESALQFLNDNDVGAALASFTRVLQKDEKEIEALVGRGIAYARIDEFGKAEADFLVAARLKSNASAILMNLALIKEARNSDLDGAIDYYSKALALDPSLLGAYGNRARLFFLRKEYSSALDDLSHIIRLDTNNAVAYLNRAITLIQLSRFETAITNLSHPSLEIAATPQTRKLAALLQIQSGNTADGLRTSRLGLMENPTDIDFRLLSVVAMKLISDSESNLPSELGSAFESARSELANDQKSLADSFVDLMSLQAAFQVVGCCMPRYMFLGEGVSVAVPTSEKSAFDQEIQALEFLKVGDLETAVACYRESLRHVPENNDVAVKLAITLMEQGRVELAVEEIQKVVNRFPNDPKAFTLLSMLNSRLGKFKDSIGALDHAISIDHDNPELYLLRANVKSLAGVEQSQILEDCNRAERLGLSTAALFKVMGETLLKIGDNERAVSACDKAIQLEPRDVSIWLNRSIANRSAGHLQKALDDAKQAISIDSKNTTAYFEASRCFSDMKKNKEALYAVDLALKLSSSDERLQIQKARILMKMDQMEPAFNILSKCDRKSLSRDEVGFVAMFSYGRQEYDKAWSYMSDLLEVGTPSAQELVNAARIAFVREDYIKAQPLLTAAIKLESGNSEALSLLGQCASNRGDFENALKYFKKSLTEGGATSVETWLAAGDAFEKSGEKRQAVSCYSKALELDTSNKVARLSRAKTLVAMKNFRGAMEDLKWLSSRNSNDEVIIQLVKLCQSNLARSR